MGQCYSCVTRVRMRSGINAAFESAVEAGREVLMPAGYDRPLAVDSVLDQVKYLFRFKSPQDGIVDKDARPGGTWFTVTNGFDQSYSWFGVIDRWWFAVAPFLDVDSDMEIDVDEGVSLLYIGEDGKPRRDWCEHDEEEEDDE